MIGPFDAWTVVADEPEPWGSHATLDDALAALAGRGGAVTSGMTFLRWADDTEERARNALRSALRAHGFRAAATQRDTRP